MAKDKVKAGHVFEFDDGVKKVRGHVTATVDDYFIIHDPITRAHTKVLYTKYNAAQITEIIPDPEPTPGDTGGIKPK